MVAKVRPPLKGWPRSSMTRPFHSAVSATIVGSTSAAARSRGSAGGVSGSAAAAGAAPSTVSSPPTATQLIARLTVPDIPHTLLRPPRDPAAATTGRASQADGEAGRQGPATAKPSCEGGGKISTALPHHTHDDLRAAAMPEWAAYGLFGSGVRSVTFLGAARRVLRISGAPFPAAAAATVAPWAGSPTPAP